MPPHGARAARLRTLPAGVLLLYLVLAAVILIIIAAAGRLPTAVSGVYFLVQEGLAAGLSLRAARQPGLSSRERRGWRWIAGAVAAHTVSAVLIGSTLFVSRDISPMLVAGVLLRLVFVSLLLVGLLSFSNTALSRQGWFKVAMDATTVVGGGLMVIWYFLVGPILQGAPEHRPAVYLTLALYPTLDLVLLVAVGTVLLRGVPAAARRPVLLLVTGTSLYLVEDLYVTWWSLHHSMVEVGLNATTVAIALPPFLVAGAAAVQCQQAGASEEDGGRQQPLRPINGLPYLTLLLGFGLMLVIAFRAGAYPWPGLVASAIVMSSAVALRQITAMRENHALAVTDSLTGLANRVLLRDRLQQAFTAAGRSGRLMAVLQIDLDGFKQVNDSLGHEGGDQVLVAFARAVNRSLRESDVAVRLGGDEFAVLLPDVDGAGTAAAVAERVLAAADAEELVIGGRRIPIRASVGIALSGPDCPDPAELLHRADIAMYAAKRRRSHGWELYVESMAQDAGTIALRDDLVDALAGRQFHLHYQPIVSLTTGDLIAVEALVRWRHPTRGLLAPTTFIPLAEETGIIDQLGNWVLEEACGQVQRWQSTLPSAGALYLSVNCSPLHVDRGTLAADVLEILARTGFGPEHLVLEITEGTHLEEENAIPQLALLRAHGVRIALDDFGTGYASLRYLAQLPVDILKLDRFFVAELNGDPEGSAVAEAVIRLGQALNLDTVAEGIEDPRQVSELTRLGFSHGQGFHFARPLDPDELERLILEKAAGREHGEPAAPSAAR